MSAPTKGGNRDYGVCKSDRTGTCSIMDYSHLRHIPETSLLGFVFTAHRFIIIDRHVPGISCLRRHARHLYQTVVYTEQSTKKWFACENTSQASAMSSNASVIIIECMGGHWTFCLPYQGLLVRNHGDSCRLQELQWRSYDLHHKDKTRPHWQQWVFTLPLWFVSNLFIPLENVEATLQLVDSFFSTAKPQYNFVKGEQDLKQLDSQLFTAFQVSSYEDNLSK